MSSIEYFPKSKFRKFVCVWYVIYLGNDTEHALKVTSNILIQVSVKHHLMVY